MIIDRKQEIWGPQGGKPINKDHSEFNGELFEGKLKLNQIAAIRGPKAKTLELSRELLLLQNPDIILLDGQILSKLFRNRSVTRTPLWREDADHYGYMYAYFAAAKVEFESRGKYLGGYPTLYVGDFGDPVWTYMGPNEVINCEVDTHLFAVLKV